MHAGRSLTQYKKKCLGKRQKKKGLKTIKCLPTFNDFSVEKEAQQKGREK